MPAEAAKIPSAGRLASVDGLRALAIFMVFTYHVWQFSGEPALQLTLAGCSINLLCPIATFPAGVDLFMVLSGFCLALPLFRPGGMAKWSVKEYAIRRLWRIVPPYYAAIAFCILLPQFLAVAVRFAGVPAKTQVVPAWWDIGAHLLFIHTLFPQTWAGITGAFWSLGLEAQFYATFPVLVLACMRFGVRRTVAGMIVLSLVYRAGAEWLLADRDDVTRFLATITFPGRWMQFGLGMLAASITAGGALTPHDARRSWLIVGPLLVYAVAVSPFPAAVPLLPMRDLLLAAAFSMLILAVVSPGPARSIASARPVAWLGFVSYSVFLIHQPVAWLLSEMFRRFLGVDGLARFGLLMTAGLAIVLTISAVFFRIVEYPFIRGAPFIRLRRGGTKAATAPASGEVAVLAHVVTTGTGLAGKFEEKL